MFSVAYNNLPLLGSYIHTLHSPASLARVGHIFCACDYGLARLSRNNCMFYVPNLNSLIPMATRPGTEGKAKVPTRSKVTVGRKECLEDASGFQLEYWECLVALASPPSPTAARITAYVTQGLNGVDSIFGIYSIRAFEMMSILLINL